MYDGANRLQARLSELPGLGEAARNLQIRQAELAALDVTIQEATRQLDNQQLQARLASLSLGSLDGGGSESQARAPAHKLLHECFTFKDPAAVLAGSNLHALNIIAGAVLKIQVPAHAE